MTAFRFSETHQLLFDPFGSELFYVRDVILVVRSVYKQSREKHQYFIAFTFKTVLATGEKKEA